MRATSNKPKIMLNVTFVIVCAEKKIESIEREEDEGGAKNFHKNLLDKFFG